jgi:hypothetical protein
VELNLLLAVVPTCGSKDLSSDMLPRDPAILAVRITATDRSVYYSYEQTVEHNALL